MPMSSFSIKPTLTALAVVLGLLSTASPSWSADIERSNTYLESAKEQYEKGDLRATQIELKNALKADPNNVNARLFLAKIYLDGNNGLAAQPEIEAARAAGATINDTRYEMGSAYLLQRQFDRALTELNIAEIPEDERLLSYRQRIRAIMGQRDYEAAIEESTKALEAYPGAPVILVERARAEVRTGKAKTAMATVDEALSAAPDNVDALLVKGDLTRSMVGLEDALPYFSEAANIEPKNINARLERAATLVDLRRAAEAEEDIAAVYKQIPEHPLAHYLSAVTLGRTGEYEAAQELMNRTRGALGSYLPAIQFEGVLAYELGNYSVAIEKMETVVDTLPNSVVARRVLGATYLRQKNSEDALKMLVPLFESGQEDAALLTLIGTAKAQEGEFDEAMTFFENAVAAAPDKTNLRTQLAMSRIALGDSGRATEELESVLDVEPDSLNALVMLSLIDLREGRYEDSLETSSKLVKTYPDLALGYNLVGAAHLGLNDAQKAREFFELSLEKDPEYHEARRNLAQLYRVEGRFNEARRQYLRILEQDRESAKTMLQLAALSRTEGNVEESIEWLSRAVEAQPDVLQPRLELVSAYLVLGDNDRALNEAITADRDFGDNPTTVQLLAKTYAVNGDYDRAIESFDRWIDLQPENLDARRLKGRAYWRAGDLDRARREFKDALVIKGDHRQLLLDMINLESSQQNLQGALKYADDLREEYPSINLADVATGDLYLGANNNARAIEAYNAAWAIQPTKKIAVNLNTAYLRTGDKERAIAILEEWLQRDPSDLETRMAIANTHMLGGNYDAALEIYEDVLAIDGNNAAVLNNMAWVYQQKGDNRMVEVAERAYELDRDSPMIADTLGWILVKENINLRQGVDLLERAARRLPQNKEIRYHLAYGYFANNNVAKAKRELEDILGDGQTFGSVDEARALMRQLNESGGR
ncbi:MAG: XrtA/PEP-CTERM system TPR-repeat protein PrsT [Pseudomonadota bacterium]